MLISDKRCGKCFQSCCLKIQFRCLSGPTTPVGLTALVSFLCLNCWECRFIFVLSGVGHQIYPSDMKDFVCTHLLVGYFRCTDGFYTSYMVFGGSCGSPWRKLAHPCGQIGAGMQPEYLVILCHTCGGHGWLMGIHPWSWAEWESIPFIQHSLSLGCQLPKVIL